MSMMPSTLWTLCVIKRGTTSEEWDALLDNRQGRYDAMPDLVESDVAHWHGKTVLNNIEQACEYARRILFPLSTWPYLLLWLVWSPCKQQCPERLQCAKYILDHGGDHAHNATRSVKKFRRLFQQDLQTCVDSGGTLSVICFAFVATLARHWCANTQFL